jgi:hypothetical protein
MRLRLLEAVDFEHVPEQFGLAPHQLVVHVAQVVGDVLIQNSPFLEVYSTLSISHKL